MFKTYKLAGGELEIWTDQASVMLKQIGSDMDPVELGEGEVTELITVLQTLVKHI
jgi:hypothetical protein